MRGRRVLGCVCWENVFFFFCGVGGGRKEGGLLLAFFLGVGGDGFFFFFYIKCFFVGFEVIFVWALGVYYGSCLGYFWFWGVIVVFFWVVFGLWKFVWEMGIIEGVFRRKIRHCSVFQRTRK